MKIMFLSTEKMATSYGPKSTKNQTYQETNIHTQTGQNHNPKIKVKAWKTGKLRLTFELPPEQ